MFTSLHRSFKMDYTLFVGVLFALSIQNINVEAKREGKFMNVFQVISFQNDPCEGSGSRNGTCYTEQECEFKGGSNGGTCASGFGVCCTFTVGCGERTSENCTYFESSGVTAGSCDAEICPCNDNICQLRLDFESFIISGPSTDTNEVTRRRGNGGPTDVNANAAITLTGFTQCLTDSFSVTNPEGNSPPVICGTNTGQHMYVSASDNCNKLTFILGNTGLGTSIASRAWNIKVSQYSCSYPNLAPQGCTQYFFENTVDAVQTFNYNNGNGVHLANQDQQICVRRERNNCRICWTAANNADFAVSHTVTTAVRNGNLCCDYGAPTSSTKKGYDCAIIPFANTPTGGQRVSVFCGNRSGLKGGTTCSTRTPFQLSFRSDQWEPAMEAQIGGAAANRGFQLVYIMDSTNCNPASIVG